MVGALSLLVLGACAPTESASSVVSPRVVVPSPAGVVDPAPAGPAPDSDCDPYPSPRPTAESADDNTVRRIRERGRLIVGVSQSTPLFSYRNPSTGALEGFSIDMAREVARAILGEPDRITFQVVTSAERIDALAAGEVDLVASLMTITCDRQESILFSTSYFDSGLRVMARRDAGITALDDLGDRRACTAQGSSAVLAIEALDQRPVLVGASDWSDCLVMLQQRQVHAIVGTDAILVGLMAQDPGTELIGNPVDVRPHGLAVAGSDSGLVRFVNGVLERMIKDGTWARSYERWLAFALGPGEPPVPRYSD